MATTTAKEQHAAWRANAREQMRAERAEWLKLAAQLDKQPKEER